MKLKRIKVKGFKKFISEHVFYFEDTEINTISGENGSGKSTLAEILLLIQQAYFLDLLNKEYHLNDFTKACEKAFWDKVSSFINGDILCVEVDLSENTENIKLSLDVDVLRSHDLWRKDFRVLEGDHVICKYWNLDDPQNLIVYIESNKTYDETQLALSDLDFQTSNELLVSRHVWTALNIIFYPENSFRLLYKNILLDWAHDRLIPSKGKRDIYLKLAQAMFNYLFEDIKFSNVSANNHLKDEVVYLISKDGSKKYDIRLMSSGEKTLFYLFIYLNLINKISILIIDEPENNLHEGLIQKFIVLLKNLCNPNLAFSFLLKEMGVYEGLSEGVKKYVNGYTTNKISQVFMLTHSKILINTLFDEASTYILNGKLIKLEYNNYEKKLREIGISALYQKVLFVEGQTEINLLQKTLNPYNIKVHKLNNCEQLMQTYKKLKEMSPYLKDLKYLFMLDRDESNEEKLNEYLIEYDEDDFILLDRYEIENYLLDIDIWMETINKLAFDEESHSFTNETLEELFVTEAKKRIENTKKQYIANGIMRTIRNMSGTIKKREIPLDDKYNNYIESIFNTTAIEKFIDDANKIRGYSEEKYSDDNISVNWFAISPGKELMNTVGNTVAREIGVTRDRLILEITKLSCEKNGSSFSDLIEMIKLKIN